MSLQPHELYQLKYDFRLMYVLHGPVVELSESLIGGTVLNFVSPVDTTLVLYG
jgi:hypothetical protein